MTNLPNVPFPVSSLRKHRALTSTSSRMRKIFIGSLVSFENHFGVLWGHGLDDHELTTDQQKFREVWMACREEILDRGNEQVREHEKEGSSSL